MRVLPHLLNVFASSQVCSLPHLHVIPLGAVLLSVTFIVSKSMMTRKNPEVVMLAPSNWIVDAFFDWMIRIGSSTGTKRLFTK